MTAFGPGRQVITFGRAFPGVVGTVSLAISLLTPVMPFSTVAAAPSGKSEGEAGNIIVKMKAAYAAIETYRMDAEIRTYREGKLSEVEKFQYTFRKPDHVRIDMETPYSGMVLIYPDQGGKVFVRPGGLAGFLKLHLSPKDSLLMTPAGQRIDQTDLGLLINNINRSLTDRRRGELKLSGQDGKVVIQVTAVDHFLAGVTTLYYFIIDKTLWLPVEVRELSPDGVLKRDIIFRNLRTPADIPGGFFRTDGGTTGHGR